MRGVERSPADILGKPAERPWRSDANDRKEAQGTAMRMVTERITQATEYF